MTAGAGIVHEEFHSTQFAKRGGTLHMVQLWVNLPAAQKGAHARYQSLLAAQIPSVALPDGAGDVRVIAGQFGGSRGPARTFTPIDLWNVTLRAGKRAELALPDGHTTAFLLLSGEVAVAKRAVREGELAVFSREGASIALEASRDSALLVMSGQPIDEPIVGYGPFVMNTPAEIEQAFEDYQGGRMGTLRAS
jgi:redox-sensitive bicupin YhaK (pirin superfamily)